MVIRRSTRGYSVIELTFVSGLIATLSGVAFPQVLAGVDEYRTAGAVRYLTTRLARVRMEAILRSVEVAVKFSQDAEGGSYAVYMDGNGDGVRTADIQTGTDPLLSFSINGAMPFRFAVMLAKEATKIAEQSCGFSITPSSAARGMLLSTE